MTQQRSGRVATTEMNSFYISPDIIGLEDAIDVLGRTVPVSWFFTKEKCERGIGFKYACKFEGVIVEVRIRLYFSRIHEGILTEVRLEAEVDGEIIPISPNQNIRQICQETLDKTVFDTACDPEFDGRVRKQAGDYMVECRAKLLGFVDKVMKDRKGIGFKRASLGFGPLYALEGDGLYFVLDERGVEDVKGMLDSGCPGIADDLASLLDKSGIICEYSTCPPPGLTEALTVAKYYNPETGDNEGLWYYQDDYINNFLEVLLEKGFVKFTKA